MASATKKIKINGALYRLSSGVQVWTRRGKSQLVACVSHSDGRKERQFFEMGAEGVRQANSAVNQAATEVQTYGTAFGALSVPERQAIEVYRAYAAECIAQGVAPMSLLDVLSIGLKKAREVTSCVPTFAELLPDYLEHLKKISESKHFATRSFMLKRLARRWGERRVNSFTVDDVNEYLDSLKGRKGGDASPWTRKSHFSGIRAFLNFAEKRHLITQEMNPTREMDAVDTSSAQEPEVMTADELCGLLKWTAASKRWRVLLPTTVLGALCGIHAAERGRMRWSDIRPGGRDEIYLSRTITKTNAARMVPITPALAEWLDYFKAEGFPVGADEPMVPCPDGTNKAREDLLSTHIMVAREQGKLNIPRNALLHTAASALCVLLGRGQAADILGHSEGMLVKHYRRAMTPAEAEELQSITPRSLGLVKPAESAAHNGAAA